MNEHVTRTYKKRKKSPVSLCPRKALMIFYVNSITTLLLQSTYSRLVNRCPQFSDWSIFLKGNCRGVVLVMYFLFACAHLLASAFTTSFRRMSDLIKHLLSADKTIPSAAKCGVAFIWSGSAACSSAASIDCHALRLLVLLVLLVLLALLVLLVLLVLCSFWSCTRYWVPPP